MDYCITPRDILSPEIAKAPWIFYGKKGGQSRPRAGHVKPASQLYDAVVRKSEGVGGWGRKKKAAT